MTSKKAFSKQTLNLTDQACEKLMKMCSGDFPANRKDQEALYKNLHQTMLELMALQKDVSFLHRAGSANAAEQQRKIHLDNLLNQFKQRNNIHCSVHIQESQPEGCGVFAGDFIQAGSVIMEVELSQCMSSLSALQSEIGGFLSTCPLTVAMSNVSLSVYLLHELAKQDNSAWTGYIRSLPHDFGLILNFTPDKLELLQGTSVYEKVIRDVRNICRQYCLLHKQVNGQRKGSSVTAKLAFANAFCLQDYRWAVATVMSRNNPLPMQKDHLALIPLLDMVNHQQGQFALDFDETNKKFVLFANADYAINSEIRMHYGNRTDQQWLLYSGFVPLLNPHNSVVVTLALNRHDALHEQKLALLQLLGLNRANAFHVEDDDTVPLEFLAFARIFTLNSDNFPVVEAKTKENAKFLFADSATFVECGGLAELELKALSFLQGRFLLLQRSIPFHSDQELDQLTDVERLVMREKQIMLRKKKVVDTMVEQFLH